MIFHNFVFGFCGTFYKTGYLTDSCLFGGREMLYYLHILFVFSESLHDSRNTFEGRTLELMARKKNVTFNDIAQYTHFSKTTISRYFNNLIP